MTSAIPSADQMGPGLHDDLDVDSGISAIAARPQGLMATAQSRLLDLAEDGKTELAKGFDGLVDIANELAARVDSAGVGPLASYAWQAAGVLRDIQQGLRVLLPVRNERQRGIVAGLLRQCGDVPVQSTSIRSRHFVTLTRKSNHAAWPVTGSELVNRRSVLPPGNSSEIR